ncbi:MAG: hypothetical protein KKD73_08885 [Proteobacteria bacterium]|nr:hypothetical protein [Pseudomonadota bacterium]MBU1640556.1 hypothetical protein [Pseudomonadota bacterium]
MSTHRAHILSGATLALGLVLMASQGQAHGLRGTTRSTETICATATYDDGEPLGYGRVEIAAPDSKLPFQSGRTDRNGLFCFTPDSHGDWQIVINDELGHQVRLKTTVGQDMALPQNDLAPDQNGLAMGKGGGIVAGLAIIFGLSSGLAWGRNRKKTDTMHPSQKE